MTVESMGHFTAIGMKDDVRDIPGAVAVNTCSHNDTASRGDFWNWSWCNPTNRVLVHSYEGVRAVSVEAMWQGTKAIDGCPCPDPATLAGDWRRGKAKRPRGAWAGAGSPLITDPGEARRRIYVPAFQALIAYWMHDATVADLIARARRYAGPIFLRDWDTGRGLDRRGPMSHAWLFATWLNAGHRRRNDPCGRRMICPWSTTSCAGIAPGARTPRSVSSRRSARQCRPRS